MCTQPSIIHVSQPEVLWEITNLHDPYTIRGRSTVAGVFILLIGEGRYGLVNAETGDTLVPVMVGVTEAEFDRWFSEFKAARGLVGPVSEFLHAHLQELVAVGESLLIGPPSQRESLEFMLAAIKDDQDRQRALLLHHEARLTSSVDLRGIVQQWVENWRMLLSAARRGG